MAGIINNGFMFFAYETGIMGEIQRYQYLGLRILLVLGLLACFFGFRAYRGFCSAILFMVVAVVTSILLRGRTDWGSITTCFTVIGVTLAFFAWFWFRLDACVFCALIAACAGWSISQSIWAVILPAAAAFILTLNFPVICLCLFTAGGGVWLLWDIAAEGGVRLHPLYLLLGLAVGYGFQILTTRNQTLFKKVRPDRLTHWLEERERKRKHVGGIPEGN